MRPDSSLFQFTHQIIAHSFRFVSFNLHLFYHQSPLFFNAKRPTVFSVDRLQISVLSILYSDFDSPSEHYHYCFLILCPDVIHQPPQSSCSMPSRSKVRFPVSHTVSISFCKLAMTSSLFVVLHFSKASLLT